MDFTRGFFGAFAHLFALFIVENLHARLNEKLEIFLDRCMQLLVW